MRFRVARVWAIVATAALALTGVVALNVPAQKAEALSGKMFDPGLIIGDSVFYDFGTMTADQIQAFLDQQVPKCAVKPAVNSGDFTCLRYYRTDIPAIAADTGRCAAIDAQTNVLASTMIAVISRACNINPRVMLVTLQKEQGLVTSTNPTWPDPNKPKDYRYKIATGFSCTDSGPCTTFGFFWQVYKAASQFHWYGNPAGSFTYLKVGRNVTIHYQVASVSGCGTKTFQLKSQATAALYYYTPYTPNDAALANLYGSGDKCSAYGNRNFWRYYWDWFGSPVGGGFLLKSATSGTYLIVPNTVSGGFSKYLLSDPTLADAYAPLGPVGVVSQDYLDSFTDAGSMGRLVKSAAGQYYFIDGGKKFPFSSCDDVANLGLNCADAIQLTSYQLNAMLLGTAMTALIPDDPTVAKGPQYLIQSGVKREILDAASVTAAGITLPAASQVGISAFASLPWGPPIAREGVLFTNRSTSNVAIISSGKYYEFASATSDEVDLKKWFTSTAGTLSDSGVDAIRSGSQVTTVLQDGAGNQYLLTPAGRIQLASGTSVTASATALADSLLSNIPVVGTPLQTPFLAKTGTAPAVYWIADSGKRTVLNAASVSRLGVQASTPAIQILPASALGLITTKNPVLAPASLVQDPSGKLLLTDGLDKYVSVPTLALAAEAGLGSKPVKVAKLDLSGYSSAGKLSIKISCGQATYLSTGGYYQPINDAYAAAYPGAVTTLDATTCAGLKLGTTQLGRVVISPAKLYYLVSAGKRRLTTKVQYKVIRGTTPAAFKIDATLALAIAVGTPLPAKYATVLVNPLDQVTPTPSPSTSTPGPSTTPSPTPSVKPSTSPTPSVKPSVSPTPTVTPTPTKTPTPTPTPSVTARTYIVVAGDTLTTIARKFASTVTAIKTANSLTSDLIKVGQKLVIP